MAWEVTMVAPLVMVVQRDRRFLVFAADDVDAAALSAFRAIDGKALSVGGGTDGDLADKARNGDAAAAMRLMVRLRTDGRVCWALERVTRSGDA